MIEFMGQMALIAMLTLGLSLWGHMHWFSRVVLATSFIVASYVWLVVLHP